MQPRHAPRSQLPRRRTGAIRRRPACFSAALVAVTAVLSTVVLVPAESAAISNRAEPGGTPLPNIAIEKAVSPLSRPEPGGGFTFALVVTNMGLAPVTITSLTDDIYGNLNDPSNPGVTANSCVVALGVVLAAANPGTTDTFTCSFTGQFFGSGGSAQTDVVTAIAVDQVGNAVTDSDDATVILTRVFPTITLDKTASPLSRPAPGGAFTFHVVIVNTGPVPVVITSLTDNIYGNLDDAANPSATANTCLAAVGTVLAAANAGSTDTFTCSFTGFFTGSGGDAQTDTVVVAVVDDDGDTATDSDDAVVSITAVVPPPADFDGDGDTDRSVFRNGAWFAQGQATAFLGTTGDIPVPADYDGDGDSERAVYRNGAWFVDGQATVFHGLAGDVPVPADYDGDGDADRAVYRPSVGGWYVVGQATVFFGASTDIPVPADYDGDGDADRAVYRPSAGAWYVNGQATVFLGLNGDVPVPGDYDGNGTVDRGVFRRAVGGWYVQGQGTVFLGLNGDVPVPGDYDADGTTDRGVWRPSVGGWYVQGQATAFLGLNGDIPLPLPQAVYRAFF